MRKTMKQGFTLIEMLVVMILLALLVGVVFPVLVQQVDDAEPAKVANDLVNIRTAIEVFQLNVRPQTYPASLKQLAESVTASSDNYLSATTTTATYSTNQAARWKGPYIDKNVTVTTGNAFSTGFGGEVQSDLVAYDATTDCLLVATDCSNYSSTNPTYLAVKIAGLEEVEAQAISRIIDGDDGLTTGQFRWHDNHTADTDIGYYLAVPLR